MDNVIQMLIRHPRHASQRSALRGLAAAALTLGLAACALPPEIQGNLPDPGGIAQVVPGKSTKADVTRLMGSPSSTDTFEQNTWFYASRRVEYDTVGNQTVLDQRVFFHAS